MKYKFYITGDTNDLDHVTEDVQITKKVIDEWFEHMNKYIDDNGKFINIQDYKNKWAKSCSQPRLVDADDDDAQSSLFEVMSTFIPSYDGLFSHRIESINVMVESEEDFPNFQETKRMAEVILKELQTEKMKKYMYIERDMRI